MVSVRVGESTCPSLVSRPRIRRLVLPSVSRRSLEPTTLVTIDIGSRRAEKPLRLIEL